MTRQYSYNGNEVLELHPLTQKKAADASQALSKRGMDWRPGSSPMHIEYAGGVELAFLLVQAFEVDGQQLPVSARRKRLEEDDSLRAFVIEKASELRDELSRKSETEGKNS